MFNEGTFFPPATGSFQTTFGGGDSGGNSWGEFDIGIIKLSPNGSNRIYATYLGGSGNEMPQSIICDPQGNLIVAGRTNSQNYPVKPAGNIIGTGGNFDIIVTKLNATGGLAYSTYLGGNQSDSGFSIACDSSDNAYVAGSTLSSNFPTANAFQSTNGGGSADAFVSKLNTTGLGLVYSTYLI